MLLNNKIRKIVDDSVLCWLATVSEDNIPNVSPKEVFTYFGKNELIIANIASPNTVRNIKCNTNVCVSFIDILVQKGFQIKGKARIVDKNEDDFAEMKKALTKITKGRFDILSVIAVSIESSKAILAPNYLFYPETTEKDQIAMARKRYGI